MPRCVSRAFLGTTLLGALVTVGLGLLSGVARGQSVINVTNNNPTGTGSMTEALNASTLFPGPFTIEIAPGLLLTPQSMYFVGAAGTSNGTITINGNGATVDMSSANGGLGDRAFFIASGNVSINNLTILDGRAIGGNGVDGGGGGAGLGGAIFVAASQSLTGPGLATSLFTFPTNVTLKNVSIASSQATGGAGLAQFNEQLGGGGGMGGNGAFGARATFDRGGGGGGGFGVGADGGASGDPAANGATGSFANIILTASGAALAGGAGGADNTGDPGGDGGQFGGGGGGAKTALSTASGAGGGVGGGYGLNYFTQVGPAGTGGFGGGGGGAGDMDGGLGGFGGGGGGAVSDTAGNGGFGGGGGGGATTGGSGGFGAGNGASGGGSGDYVWQGGGGLGAGGGIFVMAGATLSIVDDAFSSGAASFTGNSVTGGAGFQAGSALGTDLFLGADVTFDVGSTRTVSIAGLGGAGDLGDPNVAKNANDSNAQGGIIKTGGGTLILSGPNTFSGPVAIDSGTLATAGTAAALAGTGSITVAGGATLLLGQSDGVNDAAIVTLLGGSLQSDTSLHETFGALAISGIGASVIDFLGNPATLVFASLSLGGGAEMEVWNYAASDTFLQIATGSVTGDMGQIRFYGDAGTTFLGTGGFDGTRLVPVAVPEPTTAVMALVAAAVVGARFVRRRQR